MPGPNLHRGASGKIFNFARLLRQRQTPAEKILWECLRGNQPNGHKFRRQHPIKDFIADFYCYEARLIIEVDGKVHEGIEAEQSDDGRTCELTQLGIRVIRFKNGEVLDDVKKVVEEISKYLNPGPSSGGERGRRS